MKKTSAFAALLLVLLLAGCAAAAPSAASQPSASPAASASTSASVVSSNAPSAEPSDVPVSPSPDDDGLTDAYFALFQNIFKEDPGLNDGIKYLTLDLSKASYCDAEALAGLFQAFCDKNGLTLMRDTYEGLADKGYIKNMFFEEGLLVRFEDESKTETKLVTKVSKWRSGDGALGGSYELKNDTGTWELDQVLSNWIS